MIRKNLASTITTLLCALVFIVIGSCFSAFIYKEKIIKVSNPKLVMAEGISVFSKDGDKEIDELELSKMKLGLKPATGEEDANTNIPTTVTDKQGSEGQYATFKLYAPNGAKIFVTNIVIESEESKEKIEKERENIMVSIKQLTESTSSLKEDKVELGTTTPSDERHEMTFFIWLSGKASEVLEASKISFDLTFEPIT